MPLPYIWIISWILQLHFNAPKCSAELVSAQYICEPERNQLCFYMQVFLYLWDQNLCYFDS